MERRCTWCQRSPPCSLQREPGADGRRAAPCRGGVAREGGLRDQPSPEETAIVRTDAVAGPLPAGTRRSGCPRTGVHRCVPPARLGCRAATISTWKRDPGFRELLDADVRSTVEQLWRPILLKTAQLALQGSVQHMKFIAPFMTGRPPPLLARGNRPPTCTSNTGTPVRYPCLPNARGPEDPAPARSISSGQGTGSSSRRSTTGAGVSCCWPRSPKLTPFTSTIFRHTFSVAPLMKGVPVETVIALLAFVQSRQNALETAVKNA